MSQPWNPLRDLMLLQDRMNRLFEDATQRRAGGGVDVRRGRRSAEWYPAAEIYEKDGEYEIAVDLPGIDRSALEINVDDNRLSLRETARLKASSSPQPERPQRPICEDV